MKAQSTIVPPYDLIFITYDEPEAESNWDKLRKIVPSAKRVHGVKGIARAWKEASLKAQTSHFFTMDGDSQLMKGFKFDIKDFYGPEDERVHVYRCLNRVNALIYGYGSIHLFPTKLVRDFTQLDVVDFTLSVATKGFKIQPEVASISCFNTSPYISWKSGFRESAKLASQLNAYVGTQPDEKSINRLKAWTTIGRDSNFGAWCLLGARMGAYFGFQIRDTPKKLDTISDHKWFRDEFEKINDSPVEELLNYYSKKLEDFDFKICEFDPQESQLIKTLMHEV